MLTLGPRIRCLEFMVWGSGFRVGFEIQRSQAGLGLKVLDPGPWALKCGRWIPQLIGSRE